MLRPSGPLHPPPLPLLITGIAGVAGYNALDYFQSKYPGQVFGMRQADNRKLIGPNILACDAEDLVGLKRLFDRHRFASVLDCAGNCALKACQLAPGMARIVNVQGVENLMRETVPRGVRVVHLSIDLVFSGEKKGGYVENDPTDPVTVYGQTMVEGERVVLEADPTASILRISLPMGISFNGHAGAIDWIASRFKKARPATLYFDEVRTPTYTDCMNRLYEVVLASGLRGIFHAGGPRRLSLYEIAQIINRVGGYDPACLFGIPRADAGPIPPRAGNVTLDSSKLITALALDPFDPWPLDDRLVPTHRQWHHQRPADRPGSPDYLREVLHFNPARRA